MMKLFFFQLSSLFVDFDGPPGNHIHQFLEEIAQLRPVPPTYVCHKFPPPTPQMTGNPSEKLKDPIPIFFELSNSC